MMREECFYGGKSLPSTMTITCAVLYDFSRLEWPAFCLADGADTHSFPDYRIDAECFSNCQLLILLANWNRVTRTDIPASIELLRTNCFSGYEGRHSLVPSIANCRASFISIFSRANCFSDCTSFASVTLNCGFCCAKRRPGRMGM
jgi:hypothetical protein